MPKKANKKEQKKTGKLKNKEDEDELSELLQKSLKEKPTDVGKDFDEEENEGEGTDIDLASLEFHQFLKKGQEGTPVLERIAGSAPRPRFFGTAGPEETGEIKYEAGVRAENEPAYSSSQTTNIKYEEGRTMAAEPPVLRPSGSEIARETRFLDRSAAFVTDARGGERWNSEPEKFSSETVRGEERRLPFESHEKKYKEFKPRKIG